MILHPQKCLIRCKEGGVVYSHERESVTGGLGPLDLGGVSGSGVLSARR